MAGPVAELHADLRIGPYELVRKLGRGGFAEVWLGRRKGPGGFESRVAIKMVRIEFRSDPAFQKMFLDEAKLAARITHPNVVSIFELGEMEDILYLVMEYVSGRPLNELNHMMQRKGQTVPVGIVMRILADTCAGLHAAHELEHEGKSLGVIHRDVSPQNILVSDKGMVKLIDFGVAKANDRLAADTTAGHTKGKLRYMAPEQALAKPVDRRADIWAVGAVAFDLIEGSPPFDGHNDLVRLFKLMDTSHSSPVFTKEVPAPIAKVIKKSLERDAGARYATAAEMRAAIEGALDECGLRVTADDVAAFFGDALTPSAAEVEDDARSDGSVLRDRLQRASARAAMATVDVPAPDGSPPVSDDRGADEGSIETLSALNTSPHGVPRRPSKVVLGVVGVVALLGIAAISLGLRHEPSVAPAAAEPTALPAPASELKAIPEPAAPAPSATEESAASAPAPLASGEPAAPVGTTNDPPRKKPALPVKTSPRPRPGKPPAGAPSSRPRYDDTIQ